MSNLGFQYFVTFVDDYSRVTWLYLMKNSSELFSVFSNFVIEIQTQFGCTIRLLCSGNALEYFSSLLLRLSRAVFTVLHYNRMVLQNGKNHHLMEANRASLFDILSSFEQMQS